MVETAHPLGIYSNVMMQGASRDEFKCSILIASPIQNSSTPLIFSKVNVQNLLFQNGISNTIVKKKNDCHAEAES